MLTVTTVLILLAFACTIAHAVGKCPLWVAVLLITLVLLIGVLPLR
jgi:hypothetical protein